MSGETVQELFNAEGRLLEVGSHRPVPLAAGEVWLVERGFADVFAVPLRDGVPAGARRHLARVSAGAALFGAEPRETAPDVAGAAPALLTLVAVGAADTRLRQLERARLWSAAHAGGLVASVVALVEHWVEVLCGSVTAEVPPRASVEIPRTGDTKLAGGAAGRAAADLVWLRCTTGRVELVGRAPLRLTPGELYPVSRRLWLVATGASQVTTVAGDSLGDALWDALARGHALLLAAAADNAARATAADVARLQRQQDENASALVGALQSLGSTMTPALATVAARERPSRAGPYDVLLTVMRRVAQAAGLTLVPPPPAAARASTEDPVLAVARASRFRTRQVSLAGEWWRHDSGPLLGFLQEGGGTNGAAARRAVALLPNARGYSIDEGGEGPRALTPADHERLLPIAFSFYRPFPETALALRDVLAFAFRGCGADLRTIALLTGVASALGAVTPFATGLLFGTVIPTANRAQLAQITVMLLVVAVASAMFELVRTIALLRIEGRMQTAVQAALWDRLLALPLTFFRRFTAGDLAVRAMSIDGIRQLLTGSVVMALLGAFGSAFNVGMMFWYSPRLAWWGTLLIVIALLATLAIGVVQLRRMRVINGLRARTSGLVLQFLTSIAKLRAAAAELRAYAIWARVFGSQRQEQYRSRQLRNGFATWNAAFPIVASLVIFYVYSNFPEDQPRPDTGAFLAFLSAFTMCVGGVMAMGTSVVTAMGVIPLYEQVKPVLLALPEVSDVKRDPGELEGDIEAQHLTFRYAPDAPPALRDVSFHIKPGEFVALVGPSGSGKSSIVRALLAFETLESGAIYLDGQELSGLDVQAVRRQIGVVIQNGRLGAGDIFTNIVGNSLATINDAWDAARRAGLDADIREMPMGMHTVVSEGGGTLSGGQRQRLLIARALVNKPKIVVFDEATSALDNRSQEIVTRSLAELNATRLVIAHRLSTVVDADRIIVLVNGQVVETGTYDSLMRANGTFAELARRQLA